jgi:DNA-binding MarR family transcriptional regulator
VQGGREDLDDDLVPATSDRLRAFEVSRRRIVVIQSKSSDAHAVSGEAPTDGEIDAAAGLLVDALAQSAFVVMGALTRIGAAHDLSLTQMRALGILRDRRLRMAELAGFLGLERSTLSGLVDRAERRGLLARERSADDGRAVDVFTTPAGVRLAECVHADVHRALLPVTGRLDAGEREALTGLLERMLGSARP